MLHIIIHVGTLWEKSKHVHNMTKASVKYKLQYTFSDTSWSRITKTKNLKLKFWTNLRHMWVEFVVGSLPCSERFFSGYSGFPVSSKTNIPNSNSTRNQVDEEPLCGCVTCKFLFIYLFILFLSAVQGCTCSYKERLSMLFNNSSWHFYTTSPSKLPLFHFPEQFELAC